MASGGVAIIATSLPDLWL